MDIPFDITFVIGGRSTAIEAIGDAMDRVLCRAASHRTERRLRDVLCPSHQQRPRIIASGASAERLTFSVEGCCQPLIDTATAALQAN
jgi:hypothetical protein